jgi:hypothetical protein
MGNLRVAFVDVFSLLLYLCSWFYKRSLWCCWTWWYTDVTPALGMLRQEDQEFESSLGYVVSSRLTWATKRNNKKFWWFNCINTCLGVFCCCSIWLLRFIHPINMAHKIWLVIVNHMPASVPGINIRREKSPSLCLLQDPGLTGNRYKNQYHLQVEYLYSKIQNLQCSEIQNFLSPNTTVLIT